MNSEILTPFELRRYSEQINLPSLGLEGQEKFKKTKVLVIGAGGMGTSVIQNLAVAGIGKIGICDNDLVDINDLPKQRLYGNKDVGKQKAIISRQKLQEMNIQTDSEIHNICLTDKNVDTICKNYDILIDTTDNFLTHYIINDSSTRLNKPMVLGLVFPPSGYISVFNYLNGPSLRTLFPEKPKRPESIKLDGIVATGILCNIAGTIVSNETLKISIGLETALSGNLLEFDVTDYSVKINKINKNTENLILR